MLNVSIFKNDEIIWNGEISYFTEVLEIGQINLTLNYNFKSWTDEDLEKFQPLLGDNKIDKIEIKDENNSVVATYNKYNTIYNVTSEYSPYTKQRYLAIRFRKTI